MTVNELCGKFKIVLASASPRRKEILDLVGMEYDIWPSEKEECVNGTAPKEICMELARMKALDVASQIRTYNETHDDLVTGADIIVIGADTIVAKGDVILTKPKDEADAIRMLKLLSGDTHSVFTGVSFVFISREGRVGEHTFFEETKVTFYPADDKDIEHYVSSYDEAYADALAQAVEASRAKAQVLASAAGVTLGRVVNITEGYSYSGYRYSNSEAAVVADEAGGTMAKVADIAPGQVGIEAQVTVSYSIS